MLTKLDTMLYTLENYRILQRKVLNLTTKVLNLTTNIDKVCHNNLCFRPYKLYIFWKLLVQRCQKWYYQVSHIGWNDVSLPSHCWNNGCQPLKTIVSDGWLSEKPSKNHCHQWLGGYHSINGNSDPKNHWFLANLKSYGYVSCVNWQ